MGVIGMEELIVSLKKKGGGLCVEKNALKITVADKHVDSSLKQSVADKKEEIIELLQLNNVDSYEKFRKKKFFKTSCESYPLFFSQERLFFIDRYEKGSDAYNVPLLFKLNKNGDVDTFLKSVQQIIDRHKILKTIVVQDEQGNYRQKFSTHPLRSRQGDFSSLSKDCCEIFKLQEEMPIKVTTYTAEDTHYVLVNIHHIVCDGWSIAIFYKELLAFYKHFKEKTPLTLPPLEIQYQDYSLWQRSYLSDLETADQINYWKEKLQGCEKIDLPLDRAKFRQGGRYSGDHVSFEVDPLLSDQLRNVAKENGVTLHTVLLSGFFALLHVYTQQDDLIVGVPVANRDYRQVEHLIGLFVNSLPMRLRLSKELTLEGLIKTIHCESLEVQIFQELPFENIVKALNLEQDPATHPVFQVMFTIKSHSAPCKNDYFESVPVDDYFKVSKFDLSLLIDDTNRALKGTFTFASALFDKETLTRMRNHYLTILYQLVHHRHEKIHSLNVLSEKEYDTLINQYNATAYPYPENKTLNQLFEEQVEKTPDKIALVFRGQQLTYRQLNAKANQLAHALKEQIRDPEEKICLLMERSLEMVIAILGVLKAGAAYVPIDPAYPEERIRFTVQDTGAKLVLTEKEVRCDRYASENITQLHDSTHLAYVIYTSGSSGKPKGVMVEHRSVANTIASLKQVYDFSRDQDRVAAFSSYVFDVSVSEIFASLLNGAELHLLSQNEIADAQELATYLNQKNIHYAYLPPAVLSVLPKIPYPSLKTVIFAGEPCPQAVGEYWAQHVKLYNYYGPTEATIYAAGTRVAMHNMNIIGKPINNAQAYVLNRQQQPVPIGVIGERYIGGAGVARGYSNQPELTEKHFIQKDKRLYKTGDLARWLPTGDLEYVGRNDHQVKIRGYRIELGEISNVLLLHDCIRQCFVIHQRKKTVSLT